MLLFLPGLSLFPDEQTHRHIVEKVDEDNSMIVDDITFSGSNFILSWLLYPAIFLGFYPRKKIYQKYFK